MDNVYTQSFIINRHGARYPIKKPEHNVIWPNENKFWLSNAGKLTPVGVIQLANLGTYFKNKYPWVSPKNVNVYSTKKSRALESAWSLIMGLLPGTPIKFETIKPYIVCYNDICCGIDMCCIKYYPKNPDDLFGQISGTNDFKININKSNYLQDLTTDTITTNLLERLKNENLFRIRRDSVTTISKLKDIHGQIQIDNQMNIPIEASIIGKYKLTPEELNIINNVGYEVICRRSVPSDDLLNSKVYSKHQGVGLINHINIKMKEWTKNFNSFDILSCHDTNLIAVASLFGLKIPSPNFSAYFLFERTYNIDTGEDILSVYYCSDPFNNQILEPRVWPHPKYRKYFSNWTDLETGNFDTINFLNICDNIQ